jgi:hypothetical protein
MKMTPQRIAETRELIAKATAGPWHPSDGSMEGFPGSWDVTGSDNCGIASIADTASVAAFPRDVRANAEFIAASRTSLPDALDDLDTLSQQLAAVTAERDALRLKVNPVYLDVEKYYEDDPHQATNVQCSTPAAGEKETNP